MLIGGSPYRQVTFVSILGVTLLTVISQFMVLIAQIVNFFVVDANKAYIVKTTSC